MKTKQEFLIRPNDIDLGPTFNAMRLNQRELSWNQYMLNLGMQNNLTNRQYTSGYVSNLNRMLGLE